MYEALEPRLLFNTGNMNDVWNGSGGTADAAPGMQVPANAAQWDDDPAGVITGSQTITLSLTGLPSHTMLDAYQVSVVGVEGTFNVSIDCVAQGTMQIGIDNYAEFSGGSGMEYDPSTNASHTSSNLTITLTASLSNESDQWQVYNSYISVDSYVEVSKVQDGSFDAGTPGIFRFTRSNNDGPASSDQPLNVYSITGSISQSETLGRTRTACGSVQSMAPPASSTARSSSATRSAGRTRAGSMSRFPRAPTTLTFRSTRRRFCHRTAT